MRAPSTGPRCGTALLLRRSRPPSPRNAVRSRASGQSTTRSSRDRRALRRRRRDARNGDDPARARRRDRRGADDVDGARKTTRRSQEGWRRPRDPRQACDATNATPIPSPLGERAPMPRPRLRAEAIEARPAPRAAHPSALSTRCTSRGVSSRSSCRSDLLRQQGSRGRPDAAPQPRRGAPSLPGARRARTAP